MLGKQSVIDQITILRDGQIQVKRADLYLEDGIEMAKVYHRHVLAPGDATTNEDDRVKDVAAAVWTPEVIADYEAKKK